MRIPKKYGSYRIERCPFCDNHATANNDQKIPVCAKHRNKKLPDIKCQCNNYLDLMSGKYGPYFKCIKCGNISWSRAMEINNDAIKALSKEDAKEKKKKNETVVTSDNVDVYFS